MIPPPLLDPRQQVTLAVVALWALALAIFDCGVAWAWGRSTSISWTLAVVSREHPIAAFFAATVLGHIFLVRWAPDLLSWENARGLTVILLGLAAGATMSAQRPDPPPPDPDGDPPA